MASDMSGLTTVMAQPSSARAATRLVASRPPPTTRAFLEPSRRSTIMKGKASELYLYIKNPRPAYILNPFQTLGARYTSSGAYCHVLLLSADQHHKSTQNAEIWSGSCPNLERS